MSSYASGRTPSIQDKAVRRYFLFENLRTTNKKPRKIPRLLPCIYVLYRRCLTPFLSVQLRKSGIILLFPIIGKLKKPRTKTAWLRSGIICFQYYSYLSIICFAIKSRLERVSIADFSIFLCASSSDRASYCTKSIFARLIYFISFIFF